MLTNGSGCAVSTDNFSVLLYFRRGSVEELMSQHWRRIRISQVHCLGGRAAVVGEWLQAKLMSYRQSNVIPVYTIVAVSVAFAWNVRTKDVAARRLHGTRKCVHETLGFWAAVRVNVSFNSGGSSFEIC